MDEIRKAVLSLCFSLVFLGLASVALPSGKMSKPMRIILGITILAVFVTVFRSSYDIDISPKNYGNEEMISEDLSATMDKQYISAAEQSAKDIIIEALQEKNIKYSAVDVSMDILEDNCISINEVVVCIEGDSSDNYTVEKTVKEILGIKPVIKNEN